MHLDIDREATPQTQERTGLSPIIPFYTTAEGFHCTGEKIKDAVQLAYSATLIAGEHRTFAHNKLRTMKNLQVKLPKDAQIIKMYLS